MNKFFKLLFVIIIHVSCKTATKNYPVFYVTKDTINVGEIKKDGQASVNFYVYNRGKDTLHIKSIGVDCGCTKVAIADSTIVEGDSTNIMMQYTAKLGRDSGVFYKSIVFRSNDSLEFKIIRLVGNISY